MHPLLTRQLKKAGLGDPSSPPSPDVWAQLLERISASYKENDNDRYTMERSLSLSSEEMQELHKKLANQNAVLHNILTRYVSEEVAQEVLINPEKKLQLGGDTRLISVLFADIRDYTGFSRSKDARVIIEVLNRVFGCLVPVIFEERGTLDKFMGDAVMVFYGAPVSYDDDALRAVRSAVKMRDSMRALREGDPSLAEIALGAGIVTGYAVVGNLGSERLMNYTCIGDTPNTAKRLQENAVADQILICGATYEAAFDDIDAVPTKPLQLKGKIGPVHAYEVLGLKEAEVAARVNT